MSELPSLKASFLISSPTSSTISWSPILRAKTPLRWKTHVLLCTISKEPESNQKWIVFELEERCFCLMMPKPLVVEQGQRREGSGAKACFQVNTAITPLNFSFWWEIRHQQVFLLFFFSTHSLARLYPMQLVVVMDVTSAVRMVMMMSIILFQVCFEFWFIVIWN